ncbi:MAG: ribose-phosphate diphosphokinase [Clostridia bacterium]|nr:ribose-phosphate diphosphokinase [Clostridia bacterium]
MQLNSFETTDSTYNELRLEPYGPIAIIAHTANKEFVQQVSNVLYEKRLKRYNAKANPFVNNPGYLRSSYLFDTDLPRFQTAEGKFTMKESSRGHDIYIITDVLSHNLRVDICGEAHVISPDDHYRDLLRIISTCVGKAKRVNVIMPFLYEGLQIKRRNLSYGESLDCAAVLKQLYDLGVTNLIVFDPHDPRIDNAVPLMGIEKPNSAYKIITTLISKFGSLSMNPAKTMVISPDETGVSRAVFYASMLNLPLGIFYRDRDYANIKDGVVPVKNYRFIGNDINGMDALIIDDMIKTGHTMMTTASILKEKGARDIYYLAPFGLFSNGFEEFDKAYEEGLIKAVVCTNLIYRPQELLEKEWYVDVNMIPFVARIIDALNVDESIGDLINSTSRITDFLSQMRLNEFIDDI